MKRAILVNFRQYTPYGREYYEPILDFFIDQMKKYENEYDKIYLIDSLWNIPSQKIEGMKAEIVTPDPHLRYYDAFKEVLPQVKEDLVLFTDNDFLVHQEAVIKRAFDLTDVDIVSALGNNVYVADVVSIYDTIGEYKTEKLNGKNKFCPYFFCTRKDLLMKYRDVDWGSHMPHSETLGYLTKAMLDDGVRPYEFPEDKSSLYFDGTETDQQDHVAGGRGYYHVRAGTLPALLLSWRENDSMQYTEYIKNQPRNEIIRQCFWYRYMGGDVQPIMTDLSITREQFAEYYDRCRAFHGV